MSQKECEEKNEINCYNHGNQHAENTQTVSPAKTMCQNMYEEETAAPVINIDDACQLI